MSCGEGLYKLSDLTISPISTSDVELYDGGTLACIPSSPTSSLNDIIESIDDEICNLKNVLLNQLATSQIITYDGVPTFSCFSISGSLNDVIDQIGNRICDMDSDMVEYAGAPPSNYTPTTTKVTGHLVGIDNRIGILDGDIATINGALATVPTLTVLYDSTKGLTRNFVKTGAGVTTNPGNFNATMAVATFYVEGKRFDKAGEVLVLSPNSDNYIDIEFAETYLVSSVPVGNPAPAVSGLRLYKIETDGVGSVATTDLRNVYPYDGDFLSDNVILTRHIENLNVTSAKLSTTGVVAGTYDFGTLTVDDKGRITSAISPVQFAGLADGDVIMYDIASSKFLNVPVIGYILPVIGDQELLRYDFVGNQYVGISLADLVSEKWVSYNLSYSDWQPNAGGTGSFVFATLPAGAIITGVKIKHSTPFAGGTTATATVQVIDANAINYGGSANVFQATGDTVGLQFSGSDAASIPDHVNPSDLEAELVITGDVIDNLVAGDVTIWVKYEIVL